MRSARTAPQEGFVISKEAWSCTFSLGVIPPASKPGKILPYHTTMRGYSHDSASNRLPAGDPGTPVVLHHAALSLAKSRRAVISAADGTGAAAVESQTIQRTQTLCGSYAPTSVRGVRTRYAPSQAAASAAIRPHAADHPTSVYHLYLTAVLPPCGL